jgi:hypothetical protein
VGRPVTMACDVADPRAVVVVLPGVASLRARKPIGASRRASSEGSGGSLGAGMSPSASPLIPRFTGSR